MISISACPPFYLRKRGVVVAGTSTDGIAAKEPISHVKSIHRRHDAEGIPLRCSNGKPLKQNFYLVVNCARKKCALALKMMRSIILKGNTAERRLVFVLNGSEQKCPYGI